MRSEASPRRGKKFYAVREGRETGIFLTWDECEAQVKGYPGAKFKSFASRGEAEAWLGGRSVPKPSATAEEPLDGTVGAAGKRLRPPKTLKTSKAAETASGTQGAFRRAPSSPSGGADSLDAEDADYIVYTDGSCLKNPDGPGGWAAVIVGSSTGETEELHGGSPSTTNNRMELSAAIAALSHIPASRTISLYTDSQYMKNAFTRNWIRNWKRNGWKTAKGTDVLNKDLWLQLDELCSSRRVKFRWVKGHAGISYNERCDQLARGEAMRQGKGR